MHSKILSSLKEEARNSTKWEALVVFVFARVSTARVQAPQKSISGLGILKGGAGLHTRLEGRRIVENRKRE